MADSTWNADLAAAERSSVAAPRHSALVRITHWLTTLCFFALLVSGVELIISHPRFYWGEAGNVLDPPLFSLPIPASRGAVPTGYNFVLPDQNGWSRYLHFQTAWLVVFTGLAYFIFGLLTPHFRTKLLPARNDLRWPALSKMIGSHVRFARPDASEAWSYNVLQRMAYLVVIFLLFPLMIWTGLAMSPAVVAGYPFFVTIVGGQQSARTIHFFVSLSLVAFVVVHVVMVWHAGFRSRMRAMISGQAGQSQEQL